MEMILQGILTNKTPVSWMAQMSTRIQEVYSMSRWYKHALDVGVQLATWTEGTVELPKSVWMPGLFNSKAFVTAVQQVYARANKLPLDVMKFMTECTTKMTVETLTEDPGEGAFIHGLVM